MSTTAVVQDQNLSDQLSEIEKRRRALTRLIKITHAVEQLHSGLQAALVLGKPTGIVTQKALDTYQQLNGKTKQFSNDKIRALIAKLDSDVIRELDTVVLLNREDVVHGDSTGGQRLDPFSDEQIATIFTCFRRNAQTAVALRVLLRERGEAAPALNLLIKEEELITQVHRLELREKVCRTKIKEEIIDLQEKVDQLIRNPDLPYNLKESAKLVRVGLQSDLEHIIAGRQIESMPTLFEMVELHSNEIQTPLELERDTTVESIPCQNHGNIAIKSQYGLAQRIWRWLTSPWGVSWRDINKQ